MSLSHVHDNSPLFREARITARSKASLRASRDSKARRRQPGREFRRKQSGSREARWRLTLEEGILEEGTLEEGTPEEAIPEEAILAEAIPVAAIAAEAIMAEVIRAEAIPAEVMRRPCWR